MHPKGTRETPTTKPQFQEPARQGFGHHRTGGEGFGIAGSLGRKADDLRHRVSGRNSMSAATVTVRLQPVTLR